MVMVMFYSCFIVYLVAFFLLSVVAHMRKEYSLYEIHFIEGPRGLLFFS